MSVYLPPDEMAGYLGSQAELALEGQSSIPQATLGLRIFDLLVLRGRLRPSQGIEGFWKLDTIREHEWPELAVAAMRL
jgi:hypothetical protein